MIFTKIVSLSTAAFLIGVGLVTQASRAASDIDTAFVAKVSQGGMYEVEASKLAEERATTPDVKDVAHTEVHDHNLVNQNLKKLADAAGIPVAKDLNEEFKARLEKLKSASAGDFDAAYIDDMKQIHDNDEKLFAKEAQGGSEDFKVFAHQTDQIVKRHIGALHGTG
jgi:putative membrane protein